MATKDVAPDKKTINLWCAQCKGFVPYMGHKDAVGAYHVGQAEVDAHRATH